MFQPKATLHLYAAIQVEKTQNNGVSAYFGNEFLCFNKVTGVVTVRLLGLKVETSRQNGKVAPDRGIRPTPPLYKTEPIIFSFKLFQKRN